MTNPYTPEKVAEARRRLEAELPRWERYTGDKFPGDIRAVLAALTAVSTERDAAQALLTKQTRYIEELESVDSVGLRAERDRLHKAITEALAEEERCTDQRTRMWRILRAALDKQNGAGDDE